MGDYFRHKGTSYFTAFIQTLLQTTSAELKCLRKQKAFRMEGFGAKDEIRTRDPDLGKVVLYQLSYFR
jgi:hypothetical protein